MGRPLNKKYFGNRNEGTGGDQVTGGLSNSQNYADDKIGGEGIASLNIPDAGNWLATAGGAAVPISGLTLPAPTLPGGVQATWTVTYGIEHVTTGAGSVGLVVGETYTSASFPGSIIAVASSTNNGTNATFTVTNQGATTTLPTDLQGVNLTLRTGLGYTGVGTFLVDIFTHIKTIAITEKGSGYTGAETITVVTANGATGSAPVMNIVLTTDTGAVGSATNQENAIVIYANTTTPASGTTALVGDIIKQTNTRSYKIKTTDGIKVCKLGTDDTPASGGAYLVATATGGTYYVTKLTAHRATLVTKTGDGALNGTSARWTFGSPSATVVQIENA